ncbi:C-reactive protein-like [Stegastes partitus]|uniref:Pentraxin family member n=1 Tax=Stegastes partitus TaxID=144197 RepID=A0A3B4Z7W7_9TELE|nr:PREDICTED: C-reactive protein-like [Stegastes partitus]
MDFKMKLLLVLVMLTACAASPRDMSDKMFTFALKSKNNHVQLITSQKSFSALTVCLRSKTDLKRDHALFSLATSSSSNAFLIFWDGANNQIQSEINDDVSDFTRLNYQPNMWHSVCTTWDSESGLVQLWFNGQPLVRKSSSNRTISGSPMIILGQEQDHYGAGFDIGQSFMGMISDVHMWDYVLHSCDIHDYVNESNFHPGNVLNWRALEFTIEGHVLIEDKFPSCQGLSV